MDISKEVEDLIGLPESETLEYSTILPPSRVMAQIMSSFANTKGGFLILGVRKDSGEIEKEGFSRDFHISSIYQKALSLLDPQPLTNHQLISLHEKPIFAIKIHKASEKIYLQNQLYIRQGSKIINPKTGENFLRSDAYRGLVKLSNKLHQYQQKSTAAKLKYLEHFQSSLKIMDDVKVSLYPCSPKEPTNNSEGKILMRMIFSTSADNFELYLSDLLYEIHLAKPESLKTNEMISIKEVLDCEDIEEFIKYWSRKKLSKLQRGSVKGFTNNNDQIRCLGVFDSAKEEEIERILQIRHLYSHKNGIVDDKFLSFFPSGYKLNQEHRMSLDEVLNKMDFMIELVNSLDKSAIEKFNLSTLDN